MQCGEACSFYVCRHMPQVLWRSCFLFLFVEDFCAFNDVFVNVNVFYTNSNIKIHTAHVSCGIVKVVFIVIIIYRGLVYVLYLRVCLSMLMYSLRILNKHLSRNYKAIWKLSFRNFTFIIVMTESKEESREPNTFLYHQHKLGNLIMFI